jgi:hypothetical protein
VQPCAAGYPGKNALEPSPGGWFLQAENSGSRPARVTTALGWWDCRPAQSPFLASLRVPRLVHAPLQFRSRGGQFSTPKSVSASPMPKFRSEIFGVAEAFQGRVNCEQGITKLCCRLDCDHSGTDPHCRCTTSECRGFRAQMATRSARTRNSTCCRNRSHSAAPRTTISPGTRYRRDVVRPGNPSRQ